MSKTSPLARASVSRNTTEFYRQVFLFIHNAVKAILSPNKGLQDSTIIHLYHTIASFISANSFDLDENSSISYRSFSAYFSLEILSFFSIPADPGLRETEQFSLP